MTPNCSVCGYEVEVVRSCFSSRWRLFRGRPETTAGCFISAPEGTPVYPGPHNYWSRDWVSDELDGAELGEDPDAVRRYHSGAALGWVPGPDVIGDPDCIANGATWPLTVVPDLVGGFNVLCGETIPPPREFLSVLAPGNWCYWSERILECYNDPVGLAARLAADYGVEPRGTLHRHTSDLPPQFVLLAPTMPNPWVFVCAGTVNALQWLAQVNYGFSAPRDFGTYSTHVFWEGLAQTITGIMLDFAPDPAQPIVLVGHSLGGAIVALIAAKLRQFAPNRTIQLLLTGCPRPGDQRLVDILSTCSVVSLATEEDVICSCPFEVVQLGFFLATLLGIDTGPRAHDWTNPPNRVTVDAQGVRLEGALAPGPPEAILVLALWFINAGPPPDIDPHLPEEYVRRFCLLPLNVPAVFWGQAFAVIAADAPGFEPQEIVGSTALEVAADATLKTKPSIVGDVGLVVEAAATLETEGDAMPVGAIIAYIGETPPEGYLECDGSDYDEADYPALAAVIPIVWRTARAQDDPGDGRFRVPYLTGLALVGRGDVGHDPTTRSWPTGSIAGEDEVTLSTPQMPAHTHAVTDPGHRHRPENIGWFKTVILGTISSGLAFSAGNGRYNEWTEISTTDISIDSEGQDEPHNNLPPSAAIIWCIKT
jgi:microcystin-dependent protein